MDEEVTEPVPARIELKNLGTIKNGDVIVVRYLTAGLPDSEERRKDYVAIRDYFQQQGLSVRMLGVSGAMTLDKADEMEMARFGWFKRK